MAEELLEKNDLAHPQDIVGIVAGTRTKSGSTNFLRLHVLGDRITESAKKTTVPAKQRPAKQRKVQPKNASVKPKKTR